MKRNIFLLLLFAIIGSVVNAQTVLPRLSPRPQAVLGVADPSMSLDGTWGFQTGSIASSDIQVSGEWLMQGFEVAEGETAIYSREFRLPEDWTGHRIKIRFDGVSSYGSVSVNGQAVGEHEGGMVPFEFDITDAVRPGMNKIIVDVKSETVSDRLGCVSQYACHTVGGLLRKVTLFALPQIQISATDVTTILDPSFRHAELGIKTDITRDENLPGNLTVGYILKDTTGKTVARQVVKVSGESQITGKLTIKNAKLWNSEEPYLYTLSTVLSLDGKLLQTNEQRVGLRQIEVRGNLLFVNGRPIKLRGVNRHEVHPLRGRSLTPELCRKDAEIFKAGNCNYIRTSHYPPSEEFLDACDELGLFVESEAALTWIQHGASPIWRNWDYRDRQYLPYMLRANVDNILAGRRHPSVIIWSIGNESYWSPLWAEVLSTAKTLDPSRPFTFHDQCWGGFNNGGSVADIANYHYPDMNGPAACDTMSRPTLFGEYAHLSCYNRTELATDPGVRAAFGEILVQYYDSMYYHPGCLGGALWSGIDDTFHLPDGRIVGYGPWGPIDGWRREKPEYTAMKQAYTPFRVLEHTRTSGQLQLKVENRYNFLNFNRLCIEIGAKDGQMVRVNSDIAARSEGTITIPLAESLSSGDLYLRVTDPQGFVCAEELFEAPQTSEAPVSEASVTLTTEERGNALFVKSIGPSDSLMVVFSKTTGTITKAYSGTKTILSGGPVFCIVPMNANDAGKPNVAGETYQNNIYPDKNYPHYTLFATSFAYEQRDNGSVVVAVEALYNGGDTGKLQYIFSLDGTIEVGYEIRSEAKTVNPRQYGLLFRLPASLDSLSWKRQGEFSVYPAWDIARTEGMALLNVSDVVEVEQWGAMPTVAWKDDANPMGSVDFRSTKTHILQASLCDRLGNGMTIYGDGKQALRCWLQDGAIQLLVADYSNTGSEPFYASPFTSGRVVVKKDDVLKGTVRLSLR